MFSYKSLFTIIFFSFFIYSDYLGINIYFLNTAFAIAGIYLLFTLSKKELFISGFFISLLWFWWVGYSFVYYDLSFLIPIVLISIGIVYGILFYFIGLYQHILYKLSYIFLLTFINPFGFNWFKLELLFINSYFGTSKIEFFIILLSIAIYISSKNKYKIKAFTLLLLVSIMLYLFNNINQEKMTAPSLNIVQHQTNIEQYKKWNRIYKDKIISENIDAIKSAIENKKDLIVLPETAFPLVLNHTHNLNDLLKNLSYEISIITGSLYEKNGLLYNSTYFYEKGKLEIAHKVVLVPFGEAVPMPEKIRNIINNIFYDGAKDYETAEKPTTFTIKGVKFRNAICYEGTTDAIYNNLDTSYVIVLSNNAWFTPSIQPTLQNLLLKYYQNKYNFYYMNVTNY